MCKQFQNVPPFKRVMLAVGGIRAMARLFNTRPSTVSGWRKRGCIPGSRLQLLNDERKAGRLRRTLPDGTVLEITADDLIEAAAGAIDESCPEQMADLIAETVDEITSAPPASQPSGPT
jgi:hypothetical protein